MIKKIPSQVILFDGHGTLTYPCQSTLLLYNRLAQKHNSKIHKERIKKEYFLMKRKHYQFLKSKSKSQIPLTWDEDKKYWFFLEKSLFKKIGIKNDYEKLSSEILNNYMLPHKQRIHSDVVPILTYLKNKNYILGVLTNSDSRYREILKYYNILNLFDYLFISTEVGYKKPSKEIFNYASQKLKINLNQIWYIGDNYELDIRSALLAGIKKGILIKRKKNNSALIKIPKNIKVIQTLKTLQNIF